MEREFPAVGNNYQNLLWSRGLKATQSRLKIIEVLVGPVNVNPKYRKPQNPLSIEDIVNLTSINTTTTYRIIKSFLKVGIISKINLGHNHYSYEYIIGSNHFHHVICIECGITEEVNVCKKRNIEISAEADLNKFSRITSHSLEFFGLCKACDNESENKRVLIY